MNHPAYVAAEYFLEVLRKNPSFRLNYHCINLLLEQAPKEVNSFIINEGQNDPLHLFKTFPDVFSLDGSGISLTDAFLSLYAFPLSTEFSSNEASSSVFETAAVEYFKLLLIRCGRLHFFNLFSVLLNQKELWLAQFYSHFSNADMLNFFLKHSDVFTVSSDIVFLKTHPLTTMKEGNPSEHSKAFKKLSQTTYFLLSCFSSLHYLELKQCISYVLGIVRDYLNSFPLIHQRSIFESLSETSMDNTGSLSLKNVASPPPYPTSRKVKLITLVVCFLAFEMQMHFQKIACEVSRRVSSSVHSVLTGLSVSEQFRFFKEFSDYFVISGDGYVTLLPCFVFPACTFEVQASPKLAPLVWYSKFQPTDLAALPVKANPPMISNNTNPNYGGSNSLHSSDRSFPSPNVNVCDNVTLKICDFSTTFNLPNFNGNSNLVDDQLTQLLSLHTLSIRMKIGVIYLWACFMNPSPESIFGSCLYVLNDVFVGFVKLSDAAKQAFVKEYCIFFKKMPNVGLSTGPLIKHICDQEKIWLFIVYALIKEQKMHIETLSSWINYSKVDVELNLWSNQSISQLSKYVTVSPDGFVGLNKTFEVVGQIIQRYFCSTSECSVPESKVLPNREETPLKDGDLGKCAEIVSVEANMSNLTLSPDISMLDESAMPSTISKKLQLSSHYLSNLFDNLTAVHFLETFLHALSDVKSYFFSLSSSQRQRFIKSFFKDIDMDSIFEMTLQPSEMSNNPLSDEERTLLTITYLLIEVKSAHYENIVKKLRSIDITYALCQMKAKSRFKQFQLWNEYFNINGTGFVCLSSSFTSLSSIVHSLSAFDPETLSKLKIGIKVKVNVGGEQGAKENKNVKKSSDSPTSKLHSPDSCIDLCELITDLSVSKLSFCEKMKLEILRQHFNCSDVKPVQHYFAYHTVAEMKKFFVNLPEYFDVSRDDFICLKKGVISSYVPKTSLVIKDPKGRFVLNADSQLINYNGPDFVQSGYSSEVSAASSSFVRGIKTRCKVKKKSSHNEQYLNFIQSLNSGSKKPEKTVKIVSKEKKNSSKKQRAVSNGVQGFKPHSLHEDLGQTHSISPSCDQPPPEHCSRTVSLSPIPGKITVSFHMPCQSAQSANQCPQQSCAGSNMKDSSMTNLASSGSKQAQMPRQPHEQVPCSTSLTQNSKGKNKSCSGSLEAGDQAIGLVSSLPEFEKSGAQGGIADPDHCESYGLELVSALLDEGDPIPLSSLAKCDVPNNVCVQEISGSSVPNGVHSMSSINAEFQAINFFSTVLGNYDSGASASFLREHLNLASQQVKTFVTEFYGENLVSFFLRHKRMFDVLPETDNVSLVRMK